VDNANNNKAPGATNAEGNANAAERTEKPRQSTLFDLTGESMPVVDAVPIPDDAEHCEIAERADALRRFLLVNPSGGTLEQALGWAGLPIPPRGRAHVVNAEAPRAAQRAGWAVRSGGVCRAVASRAAPFDPVLSVFPHDRCRHGGRPAADPTG